MSRQQKLLVDKSLGFVGMVAALGILGLLVWGTHLMIQKEQSIRWFVRSLLNPRDGGARFYPLLVVSVFCLWLRSFLRGGNDWPKSRAP